MRYQTTTELTPRQALEEALAAFGPGGPGLQITSQANLGLVFEGGEGHIAVTAQSGAETTLELETREWDYPVQQFMTQMHRRPSRLWHHSPVRSVAPRTGGRS